MQEPEPIAGSEGGQTPENARLLIAVLAAATVVLIGLGTLPVLPEGEMINYLTRRD